MSTAVPLLNHLKTPLAYHFNYLMLCIAWNVAGLILLANGEQALGPTASTSAIAILAGFGVALFIGAWRLPYFVSIGKRTIAVNRQLGGIASLYQRSKFMAF